MENESFSQNTDFIKKIFDFDDDENQFTNKAQRYQYIIRFLSNDKKNNGHKITDIQDEVLEKASHLFKIDITKNPSDIKKNTNRQFNKYLDELERWKFIESIPSKSKKNVETNTYQLSKFGQIIALLIDSLLSENKQDKFNKLFDYWKIYLSSYSSSLDLFCLSYLDKCKESGLFDEFAEFFVNNLVYDNQNIQDINDLFTQMILVKFNDKQKDAVLFDIWKKSYNKLDEQTQQLFSYHMMVHLNRMILRKIHDDYRYELKRFEVSDSHDLIIAETYCKNCQSSFQYIAISVMSYVSYAFNEEDKTIDECHTNIKCERCNENKFEILMVI
jgi:hypothetical protein